MRSQQSGFTLVELIAVIVVLGILAATALPKFVDLSSGAQAAALKGVVGNINSAMALNYANAAAAAAGISSTVSATTVTNCSMVGNALVGGLPTGYTIAAGAMTGPIGTTTSCTLTQAALSSGGTAQTATVTAIYVP